MLRKLHLLVLRIYLGPFIMAFAIILFLLVMQFMAIYMPDIAGKGLTLDILARLFYYAGARLLVMAMPVSLLAAGLMTFGSMGEHYELAAIKACGINLFRLSTPLIILSLLLTAASMYFCFYTIPLANLKFFSLLYDVQRKKAEVAIQPGYFYYDIDGYTIRVADKNKKTGMMYGFLLYNHSENRGNVDVISADSAKMMMEPGFQQLRLTLYHGSRYEDFRPEAGKNNHGFGRTHFDSLYYRMTLSGFGLERTDEGLFARHQITMIRDSLITAQEKVMRNIGKDEVSFANNLRAYNGLDTATLFKKAVLTATDTLVYPVTLPPGCNLLDSLKGVNTVDVVNRAIGNIRSLRNNINFRLSEIEEDRKQLNGYQYELYSMYSLPFNCLLFMLIGISFGAIIRKGGLGLPSLISIAFFVLFYVLIMQGRKLSKDGVISPLVGAMLSLIILSPAAVVALYQATTDASIFDESVRDMWKDRVTDFFRKLFRLKKS